MENVAIVQDAPGTEQQAVALPNPISTESQVDPGAGDKPAALSEKGAPEKKLSVRESLDAAAKKTEQKDVATDKTKAVETKGGDRDATGRFKPSTDVAKAETGKADTPAPKAETAASKAVAEPPARFSADAKAVWADAPDPVKHEIHRTIRNLEAGITEHSNNYAPFKPFHDLAKSLNVDPARSLREYVTLDKMLGEDFPGAMARICQNKGVDIRTFAADVLQLNPAARAALRVGAGDQRQAGAPEVLELRREIATLKQQLGGVAGHIEANGRQAKETEVAHEIAAFKASNKPMFDELSEQIATHITNSGLSLPEAYDKAFTEFQELAQRAGFIARPNAAQETDDLEAQRQRGRKSIAGAPGAGSSPATRKPSSSIREALTAAANMAG